MSSGITVTFAKDPLRGPTLSLCPRYVTYVLLTRPPLNTRDIATLCVPYDLHALATPPAFVLSQDQTRHLFIDASNGLAPASAFDWNWPAASEKTAANYPGSHNSSAYENVRKKHTSPHAPPWREMRETEILDHDPRRSCSPIRGSHILAAKTLFTCQRALGPLDEPKNRKYTDPRRSVKPAIRLFFPASFRRL